MWNNLAARGVLNIVRQFLDIITQTLRTLWAHKLRSFLTMFGIAWGVGSLLLLVGLGEGFRSGNRRQLEELGRNIVFVESGQIPAAAGTTIGNRPYNLTMRDALEILKQAPDILELSPVIVRGDIHAVSEYTSSNGEVFGVFPSYNRIRNTPMDQGRWFNHQDLDNRNAVAVLGYQMRKNMFPGRPAVGEYILLNGVRFLIIGTLDTTGRDEGNFTNTRLFVPVSTMQQFFPLKGESLPDDAISFINYTPDSKEAHEAAQREVKEIIARNHGFDASNADAFRIFDTVQAEKNVGKIFDAMNWFLGSVGLVTLALGAIGIVNIMLVAVSERTKEIGLRKAIGATNRSIMAQFFLEGAFLSISSGGIGLAGAAALMALMNQLPPVGPFDPPQLVPWSAALAIGTLGVCGVLAAVYPARRAALLEPVEALRQE